jgi:hypothetical protein
MMTLARSVLVFDVIAFLAVVVDFALVSRKSTSVIAKVPPLVMGAAAVVLLIRVDHYFQFAAIALVVTATTVFGYANCLAFLKRGITFSILHNHARPPGERRPDSDFIDLANRVEEMRLQGWLEHKAGGWALTQRGRMVLRLRQVLLKALGIEAVG